MIDKETKERLEFYRTPPKNVHPLFRREKFEGEIVDCCAGQNDIQKAAKEGWHQDWRSSDIQPYPDTTYDEIINVFTLKSLPNCVTNIPFKQKLQLIPHLLNITENKCALLLPTYAEWQVGLSDLFFGQSGLKAVYGFTQSIKWLEGSLEPSGWVTAAWFVWEKGYKGTVTREAITFKGELEIPSQSISTTPLNHHRQKFAGSLVDSLIPGLGTPGLDQCTPFVGLLWLILYDHARQHGHPCDPNKLPDERRYQDLLAMRVEGLAVLWSQEQIAHVTGKSVRTIRSALAEGQRLGLWRYEKKRTGGKVVGIQYVITPPPQYLTNSADAFYEERDKGAEERIAERRTRRQNQRPPKKHIA